MDYKSFVHSMPIVILIRRPHPSPALTFTKVFLKKVSIIASLMRQFLETPNICPFCCSLDFGGLFVRPQTSLFSVLDLISKPKFENISCIMYVTSSAQEYMVR